MALTRPRAYQIYDIDYKQAVRVVTTSNITLTGGAPNQVDGVNLSLNDRVLVTGQDNAAQNGFYYVTTLGSGSNGTWTRSIDGDQTGEILAGLIVMVTEGNAYADTQWKLITNDPIVVGTTPLQFIINSLYVYFTSISAGGNTITASGNNSVLTLVGASGVTITSNTTSNVITFSASGAANINSGTSNVAVVSSGGNVTIGVGGTGNVAVFASSGEYVTGQISATGNITGSYIFGNGSQLTGLPATYSNNNVEAYLASGTDSSNIITTGNVTGGNIETVGSIKVGGNVIGNLLPVANIIYSLGSPTQRWKDLWISNSTIYLGNAQISANTNAIVFTNPDGGQTVLQGSNPSITGDVVSVVGNVTGGNIATGGIVSATGNVVGGNVNATKWVTGQDLSATGNTYVDGFISVTGNLYVANVVAQGNLTVVDPLLYLTANAPYPYNYDIGFYSQFQTSPGEQTQANGYQHTGLVRDQSDNTWKLFSNVVPEPTSTINFNNAIYDPILTGAISAVGNITGTGNISGNYILGNGSQLTGLSSSSIFNGTSNVNIPVLDGNVVINANDKIWTFKTNGDLDLNPLGYVTQGVGSLSLNDYVELTPNTTSANTFIVATDDHWSLDTTGRGELGAGGNYWNFYANAVLLAPGDIITSANISGSYIFGNGSQLTGLPATYGNSNVASFMAVFGSNTISTTGTITAGNITGGNLLTDGLISATGNITSAANISTGNLIITSSSQATSYSATANITGGNILTSGLISATGNITGSYIFGNGSQLTGLPATYGNTNVSSFLAAFGSNTILTTGNITSGNLITTGLISSTGNITSAANIAGGNIVITGGYYDTGDALITSTATDGNVALIPTGTGIVQVTGALSASGNVSSGNLVSTALVQGTTVSATGNVVGGNVTTTGLISVTGNISSAGNISGVYILGNGSQLTGISATYGNTNVAAYLASGTDSSNIITTANVTGGNVTTSGLVSAAGNITGNYILGNGSQLTGISATYGNTNVASFLAVFGSNTISTTGTITAGNITGGNLLTDGLISATGNITGNYILGNGSQLTGITGGGGVSNARVMGYSLVFGG